MIVGYVWPAAVLGGDGKARWALDMAVRNLVEALGEAINTPMHRAVWLILERVGFHNGLTRAATEDELSMWGRTRLRHFAKEHMGLSNRAVSEKSSESLIKMAIKRQPMLAITEVPEFKTTATLHAEMLLSYMYSTEPVSVDMIMKWSRELSAFITVHPELQTPRYLMFLDHLKSPTAVVAERVDGGLPMVDPRLTIKKLTKAMRTALNLAADCEGVVCGGGNYPKKSGYKYNTVKAVGGGVWVNGNTLLSLKQRGFIVASAIRRKNQVVNVLTEAGKDRLSRERATVQK